MPVEIYCIIILKLIKNNIKIINNHYLHIPLHKIKILYNSDIIIYYIFVYFLSILNWWAWEDTDYMCVSYY